MNASESDSGGKTPSRLDFQGSPGATVGVELELALVEADTGALVPGAPRLLRACAQESVDGVDAELMQAMIEVRTGICRNVGEIRTELQQRLRCVRNLALSLGYDLAPVGTHPFVRPGAVSVFPNPRYEAAEEALAWMTYYRVTFGLHVHVGVANGDEAVRVMNFTSRYLPHLVAVSANSPFWSGVDTGFASTRALLYQLVPKSGLPGMFGKWKEFRYFYRCMAECRVIASLKDIKWDIRPRPDLGTLEFRICDMPPTLSHVLLVVALIRSLVLLGQRLLRERPGVGRVDGRGRWITAQNRWLASRYGLNALYIRSPAGKRCLLKDDVAALYSRLGPIAIETGEDKFLRELRDLDRFETGADRQRRIFRDTGSWQAVIRDMTRRIAGELANVPAAARAAGSESDVVERAGKGG